MRTWRSLARLLEGSRRLVLLSVGVAVLQSLSRPDPVAHAPHLQHRVPAPVVMGSARVDVMAHAVLAFVLPSLVVAAALLGSLVFIDLRLVVVLLAVIPVLLVLSRVLRERVQRLVRRFQASSDRFSS